jgi:tetratricopeptide (TPR) repeat protein
MKTAAKQYKQKTSKSQRESLVLVHFWDRKHMMELFIFAFSFLLFSNSIFNNYNMDDELVTKNHRLTSKGIAAIPEIFTSPYYQDDAGYAYEYRPVVLASFAIEHDIFGENPHWSHFWNVILYSLTCVLLYKVLKLLFRNYSPIIPIAVSLLFVAHPAHTEVVCSIKNRDEILGLMFALYANYVILISVIHKKQFLSFIGALMFMLALMSKVTVVSFFFVIPIAILLFTQTTFFYIILIFVLLAIPTFFLIPIGLNSDKIFFFTIFLVLLVISYCLLNLKQFSHLLSTVYIRIRNFLSKQDESISYKSKNSELQGYRIFLPEKVVLLSRFSILTIAICLIYFYINNFTSFHLYFSVPLLFAFLMWRGNEAVSWWSSIGFYFCVYMHFGALDNQWGGLYTELLTTFVYSRLLLNSSKNKLPVFIGFLFVIHFNYMNGSLLDIAAILFSLFLLNFRIGIYLSLLFYSGILVYLESSHVFGNQLHVFSTGFFSIWLTTLFVLFKKSANITLYTWLVFVLGLAVFYSTEVSMHRFESTRKVTDDLRTIINQSKTDFIEKKQNRPIDYVEQCISKDDPLSIRIGTSLTILAHYLRKVVLPYPLSFYYGYSFFYPQKITDIKALSSFFTYSIMLLVAFFLVRKETIISFSIFFFLFSIAIFSNFIGYVPGMFADRFLLVPSIAWSIFLVATIALLFRVNIANSFKSLEAIPVFSKYAFLLVLVSYSLLTFSRNRDWKDYLNLARHDIHYVDNSAQAHNLLGLRLMKESYNNLDTKTQNLIRQEALMHFKRAVEIHPPFFNATYDIARVYSILNQTDSAILYYQKTLQLDSTFTNANVALGEIYFQQQRLDDARINFEKLIAAFPTNSVGYDKVSYIYFLQKEYLKSIAVNKMAMENMPSDPQPCIAIAKAFYTIQLFDSSRVYLKKALQLNPSHQEANALLQNLNSR